MRVAKNLNLEIQATIYTRWIQVTPQVNVEVNSASQKKINNPLKIVRKLRDLIYLNRSKITIYFHLKTQRQLHQALIYIQLIKKVFTQLKKEIRLCFLLRIKSIKREIDSTFLATRTHKSKMSMLVNQMKQMKAFLRIPSSFNLTMRFQVAKNLIKV